MSDREAISCSVSVSMKLNAGNYESVEFFLSVSNVTAETTEAEIQQLLDGPAQVGFEAIKKRLRERSAAVRGKAAKS